MGAASKGSFRLKDPTGLLFGFTPVTKSEGQRPLFFLKLPKSLTDYKHGNAGTYVSALLPLVAGKSAYCNLSWVALYYRA